MSEDKIYKKRKEYSCFCIPSTKDEDVTNNYVEKDKITFENLKEEEKNGYVKKGEAEFGDLANKEAYLPKNEVPEFQLENNTIDNAVSYKELFDKLGGINELKRAYLEKSLEEQKRFFGIGYSFDAADALSLLKEGEVPRGFDILVNEKGEQLNAAEIMTEEFIEKIKQYANEAKNNNKIQPVGVWLYDKQANDGQGEIINDQTGYDLSKINTYQVALVIPNALLKAK